MGLRCDSYRRKREGGASEQDGKCAAGGKGKGGRDAADDHGNRASGLDAVIHRAVRARGQTGYNPSVDVCIPASRVLRSLRTQKGRLGGLRSRPQLARREAGIGGASSVNSGHTGRFRRLIGFLERSDPQKGHRQTARERSTEPFVGDPVRQVRKVFRVPRNTLAQRAQSLGCECPVSTHHRHYRCASVEVLDNFQLGLGFDVFTTDHGRADWHDVTSVRAVLSAQHDHCVAA